MVNITWSASHTTSLLLSYASVNGRPAFCRDKNSAVAAADSDSNSESE